MKPQIQSVFCDEETQLYYKILAHAETPDFVWAVTAKLDSSQCSMPRELDCKIFESLIVVPVDPFKINAMEEDLSKAEISIRDSRHDSIRPIVDSDQPFNSRFRTKIIKMLSAKFKISKGTIYRNLRTLWLRGPEKNALLPSYSNCGGKGKLKVYKADKIYSERKKGGRPITIISEVDRLKIAQGFRKYYSGVPHNTLKAARIAFLAEANYRDNENKPTYSQFVYWGRKLNDEKDILSNRVGKIIFNKDERFLLGDVRDKVFGPGSVCMIDSTKDPVNVLNRLRTKHIGRFTLYFAVDVASGAYVGVYITPENPSYLVSCGCLVNIVEDKKSFCEKYGIEYRPEDWPFDHLPQSLIADRAELISYFSDSLVNNLHIGIANPHSYGAEYKSLVEKSFDRYEKNLVGLLSGNGLIESYKSPRITNESPLDACLNLYDVYQLAIREMIHHNRNTWIENHPYAPELQASNLNCTPINLWNYGVINGLGCIRKRSKEFVWLNCLPRKVATLSRSGIYFKKKYWVGSTDDANKTLEKLYFSGVKRVNIAFNQNYFEQTFMFDKSRFIHLVPKVYTSIDDFFNLDSHNQQVASQKRIHNETVVNDEIKKYRANKETISTAKTLKADAVSYKDVKNNKTVEVEIHRETAYDSFTENIDLKDSTNKRHPVKTPKSAFPSFTKKLKKILTNKK